MRKVLYCLLSFLLCGVGSVTAQYNWKNLGPDNLGSKTRALAFNANGDLLAGSEGGGLWISDNEGVSWNRLNAYNGNPNITSIAVDGNNIYVSTGAVRFIRSPYESLFGSNFDISNTPEGFLGYTGLPGSGVYVSNDNGATWSNDNGSQAFGLDNYQGPFISIQKVTVGNGRVFVATRAGLYYSDDPELKALSPAGGSARFMENAVFDVEVAAGGVVFAGTADSVYVSRDGGATFEDIRNPDLYTLGRLGFQRVAIAVAPSDPNIVYVAGTRSNGELSGIWRSDDAGENWRIYAPSGTPGFTPLGIDGRDAFTLEVFPQNPDEVLVAGNIWYTYSESRGWVQTAQGFNPTASDFIPSKVYTVAFSPNDPQTLFVGTDKQIVRSKDGGISFSQKHKGYEAGLTFSVSAVPILDQEAVISGTPGNGVILNRNYVKSLPSAQGFGIVSPINNGNVDASYLYPGSIIVQGGDNGLSRSPSFGTAFESFYGFPISPGVQGLTENLSDTIVDRAGPNDEGAGLRDREGPSMMPWVLDEVIPQNYIDEQKDKVELQQLENFIFFCSKNYVWRVSYPLGNPDGLLPRWNRLTDPLTSNSEYFTAITVSEDETHSLYVGTSAGNLYRITNPHRLEEFDVNTNVIKINSPNLPRGRWVSSIAVDPANPNRVIITYAGYGGGLSTTFSLMYYTEDVNTGAFLPVGGIQKEPIYTSKFVTDPNNGESVLLFGSESGLYSARNIAVGGTLVTAEFGDEVGAVPVYDIHIRKYVANITDEETQDFFLQNDNTVFVATHGRGVWVTESLRSNREGNGGIDNKLNELSVQLYPNPTSEEAFIFVELPQDGKVSLQLIGVDGKLVKMAKSKDLLAGSHNLPLPIEDLAAGIYIVKVEIRQNNGVKNEVFKLVKQ